YGFNKEKLIFIGVSLLLAAAVYNFMSSRPVELVVKTSDAVSPLAVPTPLAAELADTRKADVTFYLETRIDPATKAIVVNRERKTPFEPFDNFEKAVAQQPTDQGNTAPPKPVPVPVPQAPTATAPGQEPDTADKGKEEKTWDPKNIKALVDFSGVMEMNGQKF